MKKAIVLTHRDYDGIFSGCIAEKWLRENNEYQSWDLIQYDYSDKDIPDYTEWPEKYDTLIMTDVSLPSEVAMRFLKEKMNEFIWCDHHIGSLKKAEEFGYGGNKGIFNIDHAACENTWRYFFPDRDIPLIIRYIAAADIWDHVSFPWESETTTIQLAMQASYGLKYEKISFSFEELLRLGKEDIEEQFIQPGTLIKKYVDRRNMSAVKRYSFEVKVGSKFTAIAMLSTDFTSSIFDSVGKKYDLFVVANRVDSGKYKISLYGKEDSEILGDFSCADYLREHYGGSGHARAAGCHVGQEVFNKLIVEREL